MFSKFIRELVMYWRAKGINILPYLDDLLFLIAGYEACRQLARMVEYDMRLAGLSIKWEKSDGIPSQERIHLGFVVNIAGGLFKVPIQKWDVLKASAKINFVFLRCQSLSSKTCKLGWHRHFHEIGLGAYYSIIYKESLSHS